MTQKFDLETFDLPREVDIPSRTQSVMRLTSQSIPGIHPDSVGLLQQRRASSVHSAHFRDSPEEEENLITCSEMTIYGFLKFSVSYLPSTVMRSSTRHYSMRLLLLPPYVKDVPINCSVCLLTLRAHPTINTNFFQDSRAICWQSVHLLKWRRIMSQSKSDNKVASNEHFRSMARKLPNS